MKIVQAELQMASSHQSMQRQEVRETLRAWIGDQRPDFDRPPSLNRPEVTISAQGKHLAEQTAPSTQTDVAEPIDEPHLQLMRLMIEALTGRPARVFDARELALPTGAETTALPPIARQAVSTPRAGFGLEYERHEIQAEQEVTQFSAGGVVKTADGREIHFSVNLQMQRNYYQESSTRLQIGDAVRKIDPLVLNFSGNAVNLLDQRFSFDLNSDGQAEQIARLATGNAYLVFDRNADGKINNGREMFGPQSGDGFAELALLDDDRNGWIDENDASFDQLGLWVPDENGQGEPRKLADLGVGAISLNRISTPFDLKNNNNVLQGQIRSSGIFLQENGEAGTIQQIDLTV